MGFICFSAESACRYQEEAVTDADIMTADTVKTAAFQCERSVRAVKYERK